MTPLTPVPDLFSGLIFQSWHPELVPRLNYCYNYPQAGYRRRVITKNLPFINEKPILGNYKWLEKHPLDENLMLLDTETETEGLYLVEGFSCIACLLSLGVILLGSMIFVVLWWLKNGDMSAAFTAGAYFLACAGPVGVIFGLIATVY
jgi:hypothetical protein